ncbi:hypothetical protein [Amaricoccus solimangrovi]|uniref:O-antigen ligase domain-containing protein n=1 Tax=Amaricoccus solimangrovi TaxID=2589815 RepID=A0A501WMF9_9RHOB|nr:hypothetical protein [Amaricoccus solimangrovi]TPE48171.1 hypothetical protein FJM51_18385 [Amaricoccus solimangrovi]
MIAPRAMGRASPFALFNPLAAASAGLFLLTLVQYSRLMLFVLPPVASLGLLLVIASGTIGLLVLAEGVYSIFPFVFFLNVVILVLVSLMVFSMRSDSPNDYRALGAISGALLYFPVFCLCRRLGVEEGLRIIALILLGYATLYVLLASVVVFADGFQNAPDVSLILNDPFRSRRVYFLASAGALLLFLSGGRTGVLPGPLAWLALAAALAAFLLAQSRVPSAILLLLLVAWFLRADRLLAWMLPAVPVGLLVIGLVGSMMAPELSRALLAQDMPTLRLRAETLSVAADLFEAHTLIGFGMAADFSKAQEMLRVSLYFEDLGPIGIAGIGGLAWLAWLVTTAAICAVVSHRCLMARRPLERALGFAGAFALLMSTTSANLLTGDGGIVFATIWAASNALREREAALPR